MFKSIQVEDFNPIIFPNIYDSEVNQYKQKNKKKLIKIQDYLLNKENTLSVDKISKNLFLDVKPDIFLSHSHADEDDVIKLAILIEKELNLSVFVDSCVWGDAFELLRNIDDKYSLEGDIFDYNIRNQTTSNVFMILNSALHRIIYNCEAFIFLGTNNSISITDTFENKKYLSSPWIYSELQFAKLVRRTPISRVFLDGSRNEVLAESLAYDRAPNFAYSIPETDSTLNNQQLKSWIEVSRKTIENHKIHPLDILYKLISNR